MRKKQLRWSAKTGAPSTYDREMISPSAQKSSFQVELTIRKGIQWGESHFKVGTNSLLQSEERPTFRTIKEGFVVMFWKKVVNWKVYSWLQHENESRYLGEGIYNIYAKGAKSNKTDQWPKTYISGFHRSICKSKMGNFVTYCKYLGKRWDRFHRKWCLRLKSLKVRSRGSPRRQLFNWS